MKKWLFIFLALSFYQLGFSQDMEKLKREYMASLIEPTKYSLKIKEIYNKEETKVKLLELITDQKINLEDIKINFGQELGNIEKILVKSPFKNADKTDTPSALRYREHFKPDVPKIKFALSEYDKVLQEIQKQKETLDYLNPALYKTLLGLVEASKNTLLILEKMHW